MAKGPTWREGLEKQVPFLLGRDFEIDPRKTALVIVDVQYSMAHPDYGWGKVLKTKWPEAAEYLLTRVEQQVVPNLRKLLDFFRGNGLRVIYITVGPHLPDYSDFLALRRQSDERIRGETGTASCLYTTKQFEHQILPEIAPEDGDLVLNKVGRSAFSSTGLNQILGNMGVESLVVTGVATNGCPGLTACNATDLGYSVVMVDDACAAFAQELDDFWFRNFHAYYGKVMSTDELLTKVEAALASTAG